jgi:hypothetical protein
MEEEEMNQKMLDKFAFVEFERNLGRSGAGHYKVRTMIDVCLLELWECAIAT